MTAQCAAQIARRYDDVLPAPDGPTPTRDQPRPPPSLRTGTPPWVNGSYNIRTRHGGRAPRRSHQQAKAELQARG
eukprot:3529940-Prymnesium_polylepis.1